MAKSTLAVLITAAACLVAPAAASAEGTLEWSRARPGFATVQIPQDVKMEIRSEENFDQLFDATVTGGSRYAAAVLIEQSNEPLNKRDGVPIFRFGDESFAFSSDETLGAGTYRAYIIADGPATAKLTLQESSGAVKLEASTPVPTITAEIPVEPSGPAGQVEFGHSEVLPSAGVFVFGWDVDFAQAAGRWEPCFTEGDAAAEDGAYGPGCPGGFTYSFECDPLLCRYGTDVLAPGSGEQYTEVFTNVPAGRYGIGGNAQFAGPVPPGIAAHGAWISYEPAPGTAVPTAPAPVLGTPAATAPTTPGGPAAKPASGAVSLRGTAAKVRKGRAAVSLRCQTGAPCSGTIRLLGAAKATVYSIPAGKTARLQLAVPKAATKKLRRKRSTRATAELTPSGSPAVRIPVTLKR